MFSLSASCLFLAPLCGNWLGSLMMHKQIMNTVGFNHFLCGSTSIQMNVCLLLRLIYCILSFDQVFTKFLMNVCIDFKCNSSNFLSARERQPRASSDRFCLLRLLLSLSQISLYQHLHTHKPPPAQKIKSERISKRIPKRTPKRIPKKIPK